MDKQINPRRFCTACQTHRPEEGGVYRKCNRTARWICHECAQLKTVSIYTATKPTSPKTIEAIRRALYWSLR